MKEMQAHNIAALAQRAVLYEVSTTPKPGLVDRQNSGAHKDMDFFTFMSSSTVLYKGFYECTLRGLCFEDSDSTRLLEEIRMPGIACERAMFKVTEGVNTHKGIIFSLGILCAVVGQLYSRHGEKCFYMEEVCEGVREVAKDLTLRDFNGIEHKKVLTHGERLFKEFGFRGIRGEVESGFLTVRNSSAPLLRKWSQSKELTINDLMLEVLLGLMTESEDTNVIIRGGAESLAYVRSASKAFIEAGGMKQAGAKAELESMDMDFIDRNISPGGSADLLAVSAFLGMIEGIII